ncbi:hypothetical protein BDW59DRAFT_167450 [Aspergillus cavernicola]|uniref:Uncharacterized protein n=1 Tax=Aspergillus cavernicola TaxID=176166 RepID=A0ABR4HFW2_9EURO
MSPVQYYGPKIAAAEAARLLDEADVPYVLFGWGLALVGDDGGYEDVDFVIHEDMTTLAIRALCDAGYPLCDDMSCPELRRDRLEDVIEDIIDQATAAGPPAQDDPHLILSTDAARLPPRGQTAGRLESGTGSDFDLASFCLTTKGSSGFHNPWLTMLSYLGELNNGEKEHGVELEDELEAVWYHFFRHPKSPTGSLESSMNLVRNKIAAIRDLVL